MPRRLAVALDDERAAMLERLARRLHMGEAALASSLLAAALDDRAEPDGRTVAEVLNRIPDADDRARLGIEQARRHDTVALGDL